jgi:hypothetical protein
LRAFVRLVVFALIVVAAVSGCGSSGKRTVVAPRSCGILGVGIGWHVSVGSAVTCRSGMTLMRAYFRGHMRNRTVMGYACTSQGANGRISCMHDGKTVVAVANH